MFDITLDGIDVPELAKPLQFPIVPRAGDYLELGPNLQFQVMRVRMQPSYDGAVVEVERVPTAAEEARAVLHLTEDGEQPIALCWCQECEECEECEDAYRLTELQWTELHK